MPWRRQSSSMVAPASASCRTAMICSSLCRCRFMGSDRYAPFGADPNRARPNQRGKLIVARAGRPLIISEDQTGEQDAAVSVLLKAKSAPLLPSSFSTLPTNAESRSKPFRMSPASTATNTRRFPEKLNIPGPTLLPGELLLPARLACGC